MILGVILFRVILPVTDIERARLFYSSLLRQAGRMVSPGRCYFDCGSVTLACYDAEADGDDQPFEPLSEPLYFSVDDLPETFARCQDVGATFASEAPPDVGPMGEIRERPWGERSFYVLDPFGNSLCFVDHDTALT